VEKLDAVVVNRNGRLVLRCPGCVGPGDEAPAPNYRPTRLERLGVPLQEACTKCGRTLETLREVEPRPPRWPKFPKWVKGLGAQILRVLLGKAIGEILGNLQFRRWRPAKCPINGGFG